ncbi:MAG TPA: N-acetylmuramoyl-L-alanine amidase [Thermoanaerobaculia bacterium]
MKRRVLQEAVAENVDIMRGLPPRALRPTSRWSRAWMRRMPIAVVAFTLAGSTYMIANNVRDVPPAVSLAPAAMTPIRQAALPFTAEAASTTMQAERVTASAFPLAVRRVVLDAGHGGSDPGATADTVLEKEITLDIGRRLRTMLERDGFDVVVTRDADRTVALRDRASLANESKSDIFVSIHVNALERHTESRGIETYYLGATNDPSLNALATRENRVSGYSVSDMRKLLEGVYADARSGESHELASAVQKKLFDRLKVDDPRLENWGVKRAPFLVLVATEMPAILAEVGCISNEKEAAMLRRPEYRQKIAEALFDGIRAYSGAPVEKTVATVKKGSEQNG